jgi:serine/threonine protein kinase
MYLVLEYMKMGDFINVLKSRDKEANSEIHDPSNADAFTPLNDMEVWNVFRQLVSGIRYLHYQNVVHGDIKPQNLLLGEDGLVKIADFGISQMLQAEGEKLENAAGTPDPNHNSQPITHNPLP